MAGASPALKMLYCYAPEDQPWAEAIDAQLQELKRQCHITSRFDGELTPNESQKALLPALLNEMDLILLLVSPHFQAIEDFWKEMCHEAWHARWLGSGRVVALVIEPVTWTHAPAEAREILPRESVPPRAEQE